MTLEEKNEYETLNQLIAQYKQRMTELNPFANLKDMSNKEFGETWSENYICTRVSSFERKDEKGWDLYSPALGRVEVKSTRLPCKQITFNQCHPYDCDYFLFVEYDTIEGDVFMFLVPSSDFFEFNPSVQHTRSNKEDADCFTMSGCSRSNVYNLQKYRVSSWEELEQRAKGE